MALRLKWVVGIYLATSSFFMNFVLAANNEVTFKKEKIQISFKQLKKTITVEMAESDDQHEHGLMFRKKLGLNEGMLFVFSDEKPREFWMKNTLINLDIGYFDKNKKLIDVQQMTAVTSILQKDIPTYPSKGAAQYALEMSQGWFKKNKFPVGSVFKILSRP